MASVKIEVTTDTEVLIDELIDAVGLENPNGEDFTILEFIKTCRVPHSVTIEGNCEDWALAEAMPDSLVNSEYKERGSGSDEIIHARDFKEALISLLMGDLSSASVLFGRAIEDDALRTQVETILRQHGRKAAA